MNHRAEFGLDEIEETITETSLPESLLSENLSKTVILEWCQSQGARGDLAEYIQDDDDMEMGRARYGHGVTRCPP